MNATKPTGPCSSHASPYMKQTHPARDVPDRMFLTKALAERGVPGESDSPEDETERGVRLERLFGSRLR
jgi:hypothetical protein